LPHEIEDFTTTSGSEQLIAWVKLPTLSASKDTVIFMYYGHSTIASQQDAANVWDANYLMVQHMAGAAYTNLDDSTSNNNDVTAEGGDPAYDQTGQVYNAVTFDGSGDTVDASDSSSLDITSTFTISTWVNKNTASGTWNGVVFKGGGSNENYYLGYKSGGNFYVGTFNAGYRTLLSDIDSSSTGVWYHVVGTMDTSTNTTNIYIDGVNGGATWQNASLTTPAALIPNDLALHIGSGASTGELFEGTIDEVRVSDTARSAAWVAACYNNQNSPATYQTETGSTTGGQKAGGTSATTLRNAVIRNAVIR